MLFKKLIPCLCAAILLFSCEKEGDDDETEAPKCPVILSDLVPAAVKSAFNAQYPGSTVITWFNKDSIALAAYFKPDGVTKKLADFATDGSFLGEVIEVDDQHEESVEDKDSTGILGKIKPACECEIGH